VQSLVIPATGLVYRTLLGTGGIGSGTFFAVNGNHTFGREESRSGRFLDRNDYCKLHIVAHYVRTLLGPPFTAAPIGKVGDDAAGRQLLAEMREAGLDLRHVVAETEEQTLTCICVVYPDGSGGNLTVDDSACARVTPEFVRKAAPALAAARNAAIALAVPEVPLPARAELLRLGTAHGAFRVASFTSEELADGANHLLLRNVDLLALNADEAAAVADLATTRDTVDTVAAAVARLRALAPCADLSVTAGRQGSWTWDGRDLHHLPAHEVDAIGTAGAGDAHLSGILAGLAAGLCLHEAHALGSLTAAAAVTSPHTINKAVDRTYLARLAETLKAPLPARVRALLETRA